MYIPRQKHLDIDGAYFGVSFPHILMKSFPEIHPSVGPYKYVPKIYGFRVFGLRGSKYELKFDYKGNTVNEEQVTLVLKKKIPTHTGEDNEKIKSTKISYGGAA